MLKRLLENRLFVKAEKCEFHKSSVEFLGHIVEGGRIRTDPRKVKAVVEWPTPPNRTELQRFLGFAGSTGNSSKITAESLLPCLHLLPRSAPMPGPLRPNPHSLL